MKGDLDQCTVSFKLHTDGKEVVKQLSFLNPFTYQGFSFHLSRDKKAREEGLQIIIKRDPGLKFILFGFTLLVLLMLWYFPKLQKYQKEANMFRKLSLLCSLLLVILLSADGLAASSPAISITGSVRQPLTLSQRSYQRFTPCRSDLMKFQR